MIRDERGSAKVAEVEVESVAFIVCDALALDSGDYSFAYVARWAEGSEELVRETAERAIACAKMIPTAVEEPTAAGNRSRSFSLRSAATSIGQ